MASKTPCGFMTSAPCGSVFFTLFSESLFLCLSLGLCIYLSGSPYLSSSPGCLCILVLGIFPGKLFRWNASDLNDPSCDLGKGPRPTSGHPTKSQLHVWGRDHFKEISHTDRACAPPNSTLNQSDNRGKVMGGARKRGEGDWELDDLQGRRTPHPKDYTFLAVALPAPDLTVAPGSTLLLSCGASRTSLVRGSVSWIHKHPMKPEVKLLSLYVSEHAQLREMWVMGTLGGKVVLLLPEATAQDADIYRCNHGNKTTQMQLKVTAQSGRVSSNCDSSEWLGQGGLAEEMEEMDARQPWPLDLRPSTSLIIPNSNLYTEHRPQLFSSLASETPTFPCLLLPLVISSHKLWGSFPPSLTPHC